MLAKQIDNLAQQIYNTSLVARNVYNTEPPPLIGQSSLRDIASQEPQFTPTTTTEDGAATVTMEVAAAGFGEDGAYETS